MIAGEAVLVEDEGETVLRPGDCAAFPKDNTNGHHLIKRERRATACSSSSAAGKNTGGDYPDIDMIFTPGGDLCPQGRTALTRAGRMAPAAI